MLPSNNIMKKEKTIWTVYPEKIDLELFRVPREDASEESLRTFIMKHLENGFSKDSFSIVKSSGWIRYSMNWMRKFARKNTCELANLTDIALLWAYQISTDSNMWNQLTKMSKGARPHLDIYLLIQDEERWCMFGGFAPYFFYGACRTSSIEGIYGSIPLFKKYC